MGVKTRFFTVLVRSYVLKKEEKKPAQDVTRGGKFDPTLKIDPRFHRIQKTPQPTVMKKHYIEEATLESFSGNRLVFSVHTGVDYETSIKATWAHPDNNVHVSYVDDQDVLCPEGVFETMDENKQQCELRLNSELAPGDKRDRWQCTDAKGNTLSIDLIPEE
eukprot:1185258-Rhodomonas_salina.2